MVDEKEESKREQESGKEAYSFCSNSINYIRFLHRILKFMNGPTPADLSSLGDSIGSLLFREMGRIKLAL